MATAVIGSKAVGSIVKIKVNGTLRNFIIVHQGLPSSLYDDSCNGTWVLMEDIYENRQWHSSNVNDYANSTIYSYLNSTFLNLIDANIRAQIKQVKIPYANGDWRNAAMSGANGLSCKVFLLSGYEVGWTQSTHQYFPIDGAVLSYFQGTAATDVKRIANYNGSAVNWWIRSLLACEANNRDCGQDAWIVGTNGSYSFGGCAGTCGVRPAFILPSNIQVTSGNEVIINAPPSVPSSLTVPSPIISEKPFTVSWGESTDPEGRFVLYILERSLDGGAWTTQYLGGGRSTTETVPFDTNTVQYRVRSRDAQEAESDYYAGEIISVINNVSPDAPTSITVPQLVQGGSTLAVSWGEATDSDGNLSSYNLERQVDSGEWTEIYSGSELSYTDSITKGWLTVAYRVRALDDQGAYGDYTTSEVREVNNNTPPEIVCEFSGDLGEKSADFSVPYTVSDEEGDPITVTESLDGTQLRTFAYTDGLETCQVAGENFMKLSNGPHKLTISATDGKGISTHELTFTKLVTAASVTLIEPMEADAEISVCVLSVNGDIPEDADFKVEATNNGLDDEPVWEDCTMAVRTGMNYVFENKSAANGFAFNFRLHVERGESGAGGFITSVQGGFQ